MFDSLRRFVFSYALTRIVSRFIGSFKRPLVRGGQRWFYLPYGKFYIRLSKRYVEPIGPGVWCLDVSGIEIYERFQRRGFGRVAFTVFEHLARSHRLGAVFVECIHNEHLYDWLVRRGYKPGGLDAQSLYFRTVDNDH